MKLHETLFKKPGRIIGLVVVAADILLIALLIFKAIPKDSADVVGIAIGALSAKSMQVIGFYFGSSEENGAST